MPERQSRPGRWIDPDEPLVNSGLGEASHALRDWASTTRAPSSDGDGSRARVAPRIRGSPEAKGGT